MNRILIPSLLGAVIAIAGVFALLPVDQATSVHTTILTTMPNQHIIVVSAGATALNEVPLLTTGVTGTEFVGTITAMILDSTQAGGAADILVGCDLFASMAAVIDDDNGVDAAASDITTPNEIDTIGEAEHATMLDADNCEIIHVDVAANTEAIITIDIDSIT